MARLVQRLSSGLRYAPSVFGRYYRLVLAITNDDLAATEALFVRLARAEPMTESLDIVSLADDGLGDDADLFVSLMNGDEQTEIGFQAPDPEVAATFRKRLTSGLRLLDHTLPELSGEIAAIIRQIVIAGGDPSKRLQFDGGSHYQLWGGLFLNGAFHADDVAIVEVMAHECAHSLLFGFCTEEALVTNEDDELFASPLRIDLRPMDGIYHATFVSARMHLAMSALAGHDSLSASDRSRARAAAALDLRNFDAGYTVVAEHGRLTGLGRGLMEGAKAYIDSVR